MSRPLVGSARFSTCRAVVITLALLVSLLSSAKPAHADNVDQLIGQLDDDSVKIRLSAALNLTKLGDARAIPPLAKLLGNDDDKNVRSIAAAGLGKLVTAKTKSNVRSLAVNALQRAAKDDASEIVKAQASKALGELGVSGSSGSTTSSGGGSIYVNVGPMSSKTGSANDPKLRTLMQTTASKTLGRVASTMATTWPGGGAPSKAQLAQKGFQGFYVDGTLNELTVTKSGSSATISCKISMLLASYPDKSVFGFLNGGAKVQGSASASDIAMGSDDCVAAVVEDLISKKIVPTIRSKAGP
ncbi:MAG: HEAT repeat domain-containing protein [Kofleriaceae bacterium]